MPPVTNQCSAVDLQDSLHSEDSEAESTFSNSIPFTSQHYMRDQRVTDMWMEVTGRIVGPVGANAFYNEYLPRPPGAYRLPWTPEVVHYFNAIAQAESEVDMYGLIISALQPFSVHYELVDTHADEAEIFHKKPIKPDITQYQIGSPRKRFNDITMATMYLEGKFTEQDDPFDDDAPEFERDTPSAWDTLGQLTTYATAHQAAQFRTHVFQVLFFPTFARILRWDRSGVVVTKRIPLNVPSFAEFFWRYDHATPAQRGYDISVSIYPGSSTIRSKLGLSGSADLFRMSIGVRDYVVGKATYLDVPSAVGRSTRSFKAYFLADDSVVWLKDTWRINGLDREDSIYEDLLRAKVPHIPEVHAAADVLDQSTQIVHAAKIFKGKGPTDRKAMRTLRHYRIAFVTIGRDLRSFNNTRELVQAVRDAIEAHTCAYYDAGILHCDISVGNILIGPNSNGLLIDWEFCKRVPESNKGGSVSERTGTWQFMSARLLRNLHATASRDDDLESFLHVLTWVALQYTDHELNGSILGIELNRLYNERYPVEDGIVGGEAKRSDLGRGNSGGIIQEAKLRNPPLLRLVEKLRQTLAVRYERLTQADWDRYRTVEERYKKIGDDPKDQERKNVIKEHLDDLAMSRYNIALQMLRDRGWATGVFNEELAREDWDVNGGRTPHQIFVPANPSGVMRKTG